MVADLQREEEYSFYSFFETHNNKKAKLLLVIERLLTGEKTWQDT